MKNITELRMEYKAHTGNSASEAMFEVNNSDSWIAADYIEWLESMALIALNKNESHEKKS